MRVKCVCELVECLISIWRSAWAEAEAREGLNRTSLAADNVLYSSRVFLLGTYDVINGFKIPRYSADKLVVCNYGFLRDEDKLKML